MWDHIYPSTDWVESHIPAVSLYLTIVTADVKARAMYCNIEMRRKTARKPAYILMDTKFCAC